MEKIMRNNKDKTIKNSHNKNKNEEKFIRTVFNNNNSILNNSQKNLYLILHYDKKLISVIFLMYNIFLSLFILYI